MLRSFCLLAMAALAGATLQPSPAEAQQSFSRAVRIVVPYAPGGTSDILARLIAPKLQEEIGQAVVVENKPGGSGNIGADAVAKAAKDGHSLLLLDVGTLALAPSLFPDLTFDPQKDLAPVGMVMFAPYVLAVNPSVPAKTTGELVSYAKANPGKLAVANSGIGGMNHVTPVRIAKGLGIEWKNVPYRGGAAASRAVVSGESQVIFNGVTATMPFVKNKQLVGLAVSGPARLKAAPDLPTFAEAKLPAGDAGTWQGLMVTAGSPPELVARLDTALRKILAMPDIATKIEDLGGTVKADGPAAFRTWFAENVKMLGEVVRENGIKGE
ncbi:tripartite tricarboxylate transporter substrate-binding protein [Rhodoplanes sp. TEM]|uniref:Tripartite tricarboxylate transporter substrate-binding protein n=1 Tax=Rhodoplanes tepidamans TaxID=200616 RepID=A0ABT5J4X5_RHOTP|nr:MULTISPECIES: tripartite tricarboxylate transporter substrate-binding protein [Rhodoplanes]MDC7784115.1 tripartite tricarboxylate transporter substrate-binding protein [Rhodoplanes tepidamans]MDC7983210.1 tripartite tricarboxylate transporter substrate-binding protein [Rhodoplanes sp. TEM]MDQ0356788.1 tripartite-type tricarboxylate transporter receptor subunit TctC [Rhodoplanes tepidamans]